MLRTLPREGDSQREKAKRKRNGSTVSGHWSSHTLLALLCISHLDQLSLDDAVLADDLLVEAGAEFGGALLGFEVDVDDAEALVISVGPLVVIEQTPDEVTFHGDALRDGAMELAERSEERRG